MNRRRIHTDETTRSPITKANLSHGCVKEADATHDDALEREVRDMKKVFSIIGLGIIIRCLVPFLQTSGGTLEGLFGKLLYFLGMTFGFFIFIWPIMPRHPYIMFINRDRF